MKLVAIVLSVVLTTMIGLAGCDQTEKRVPVGTGQSVSNVSDIENMSSVKLDLYVQAYYLLMNSPDSLRPSYNTFYRARKTKIADGIRFPVSNSLENGLELFKKGLSVQSSGMEDLDEAVRDALLAGFKLKQDELELEPYFRLQEDREDLLARAKASYLAMQADYETMFSYMDKIETLLFKYRKTESEKRMTVFREKKNWLGYYTEESLLNAQDLLALFSESDDSVKNTDLYSKGDEILLRLESSLVSQRKAFDEARKNSMSDIAGYPVINRILTSYIGSYRDLRQHKAGSDLISMYKKYNDALVAWKRVSNFPG